MRCWRDRGIYVASVSYGSPSKCPAKSLISLDNAKKHKTWDT